jgi:hypothetical protein
VEVKCLFLALALLAAPLGAQETWYAVTPDPAICGADFATLSTTQGSSTQQQTLTASIQQIAYDEDRTIASGTWTFYADVTCASGGGPGPRIDIRIEHADSGCVQITSLVNCVDIDLTKGATVEVSCGGSVAETAFADADVLEVDLTKSRGTVACTFDYNGATGAADSRLVHPNEAAAGDDLMVIGDRHEESHHPSVRLPLWVFPRGLRGDHQQRGRHLDLLVLSR